MAVEQAQPGNGWNNVYFYFAKSFYENHVFDHAAGGFTVDADQMHARAVEMNRVSVIGLVVKN